MSKVSLETRRLIAQRIVDMNLLERSVMRALPGMTLEQTIAIVREVNDTAVIGHALRIKDNGELQKYRKTAIENRLKL